MFKSPIQEKIYQVSFLEDQGFYKEAKRLAFRYKLVDKGIEHWSAVGQHMSAARLAKDNGLLKKALHESNLAYIRSQKNFPSVKTLQNQCSADLIPAKGISILKDTVKKNSERYSKLKVLSN